MCNFYKNQLDMILWVWAVQSGRYDLPIAGSLFDQALVPTAAVRSPSRRNSHGRCSAFRRHLYWRGWLSDHEVLV